jgi:hypothetical protein
MPPRFKLKTLLICFSFVSFKISLKIYLLYVVLFKFLTDQFCEGSKLGGVCKLFCVEGDRALGRQRHERLQRRREADVAGAHASQKNVAVPEH